MKTLKYEKIIVATKDRVWNILWSDSTYPQWTKPFSDESIMKSDWTVGGKTYFLDGNQCGMVSTITSLDQPNQVIFTHLGFVKNGIDDLLSPEVQKMKGAQEKYFLQDIDDDSIQLRIEVDVDEEWQDMMDNGFLQGLEIIKKISEK